MSPVRVGTGAPGSRPRVVAEKRRPKRGVESLFGGRIGGRYVDRFQLPAVFGFLGVLISQELQQELQQEDALFLEVLPAQVVDFGDLDAGPEFQALAESLQSRGVTSGLCGPAAEESCAAAQILQAGSRLVRTSGGVTMRSYRYLPVERTVR